MNRYIKRSSLYFRVLITVIMLLSILSTFACAPSVTYISDNAFLLDTIVNIKIYYDSRHPVNPSIIEEAFALMSSYENLYSVHIENSDLDNLSINAGRAPVKVSSYTYDLIKTSVYYSQITDGLFDITTGPLIDLWAIDPPDGHIPTQAELKATLPLIGYQRIRFYQDGSVMLKDTDMIANLGAIAKGDITDKAKDFLIENGVTSAIINAGGNVITIGSKPDGTSFSVGVQDPNDVRGAYLLVINANNKAVVSSGDYERYFEVDGVRYHHILNPFTGYPVNTNISQITIVTNQGITADALSTSVLLLGIQDGLALIESMENVDAVLITKDNNIYITENLRPYVSENTSALGNYTIVSDKTSLY